MRILGVDPGSRVCGYGVVDLEEDGSYRYVECGVLTAKAEDAVELRLGELARSLTDVINELRPTEMAVEDVFTHLNARSALALAQARGAVLAVAGTCGVTVHSYAPAVVKNTVTGRGRASKEQVSKMVQALVGLRKAPSPDAADALAVAITHAHRQGGTR